MRNIINQCSLTAKGVNNIDNKENMEDITLLEAAFKRNIKQNIKLTELKEHIIQTWRHFPQSLFHNIQLNLHDVYDDQMLQHSAYSNLM